MSKSHKEVKKKSRAKDACIQSSSADHKALKSLNKKKKKKKQLTLKKKKKMSSLVSSEPSSTSSSSKAGPSDLPSASIDSNKMKSSATSKAQCDLCKLSYSSEKDLTEHLLSLMHHTKLEEKEMNPAHACTLCNEDFSSMANYREHIGSDQHKKRLNKLRGTEEKELREKKKKDKRQGNWQGPNRWQANFSHPAKWNPCEWSTSTENRQWNNHNNNKTYNSYNPNWNSGNYRYKNRPVCNDRGVNNMQYNGHFEQYNGHHDWCNGLDQYSAERSDNFMRHDHGDRSGETYYRVFPPRFRTGTTGFQKPGQGAQYNHYGQHTVYDYTKDSYNCNFDETWLEPREKLLADMDKEYSSKSPAFGDKRDFSDCDSRHFPNQQSDSSSYSSQRHKWQNSTRWEASNKDRKRHREEDAPESFPKTSKHFGSEIDPNQREHEEESWLSASQNINQAGNIEGAEAFYEEDAPTSSISKSSHKPTLDNTSDNLLERAERLCKELREKRESSHAWKSNLLKSKNNENIDDKINALTKKQQSYFKGHIKDSINKSQNDQLLVSEKLCHLSHGSLLAEGDNSQPLSKPKSRLSTFSDTGKFVQKSVVSVDNSSQGISKVVDPRREVSGTSEREQSGLDTNAEQRAKRVSQEEEVYAKATSPGEAARMLRRFTSKQLLSKGSLLKMVNSPKSRTERVQLARMLQTRGESKPNPSSTSRSNVNLEGLYDTQANQDVHLDFGNGTDTQVIKLEDLSESIRDQIMSIIGGDLREDDGFLELMPGGSSNLKDVSDDKSTAERKKNPKPIKRRALSSPSPKSVSGQAKELLRKISHSSQNSGDEDVEDMKNSEREKISGLSKSRNEAKTNSKEVTDIDEVSRQSNDGDTSLTLSSENIMNRFPTIMNTMNSKDKSLEPEQDAGTCLHDSGISSGSSASKSVLLGPSNRPLLSPAFLSSSQDQAMVSSVSTFSQSEDTSVTPDVTGDRLQEDNLDHNNEFRHKNKDHLDYESSTSSAPVHDDYSSQTMSRLLLLSEREEEVKQEMMSMELRLTRLHRLLEQAVNQINRCTERRNELYDEEKDLTSQRMSLLRAVSTKQGSKTKSADTQSTDMGSKVSHESQSSLLSKELTQSLDPNQRLPETVQENTSPSEVGLKSSLTKTEWLAKFSAYLPSDTGSSAKVTNSSSTSSVMSPLPLSIPIQAVPTGLVIPAESLDALLSSAVPPSVLLATKSATHQSSSKLNDVMKDDSRQTFYKKSGPLPFMSPSSVLFPSYPHRERTSSSGPDVMYAGQPNSVAKEKYTLVSPIMMPYEKHVTSQHKNLCRGTGNKPEETTPGHFNRENIHSNPEPTRETSSIKTPTPRRPDFLTSVMPSPRNEDSDIGSVTSLASGSSLGEKISHLCKQTPGASLVPRRHDLSVILSGPSDSNDMRGVEDPDSNDSVLVDGKKTLYGNLSTQAVKSAEALHLIERNSEVLVDTVKPSNENKKKKRKTKHERDTVVIRRRKRYILSSSSEVEEAESETVQVQANGLLALDCRPRRSVESTNDDSNSDVIEIKPVASPQGVSDVSGTKTLTSPDVTIAECDSSTNLGIVDSVSINAQSNKLREMNENFLHTLGNAPRRYEVQSCQTDMANIGTAEGRKPKETAGILISSDSDQKAFVNLCSDSDNANKDKCNEKRDRIPYSARGRSISSNDASQVRQSKFPGTLGSVCYLKVIKDMLYVGYLQFGYQIYDLIKEINLKGKGMCLLDLRCMEVVDTGKDVLVFVGQGCNVCSVMIEADLSSSVIDLGAEVTCILSHHLGQSLHVGLDTGEICVLDRKLKKRDRYICSDCPIYSMASGQEGSTRLLCVASLDSSIIVMDSERFLPLRILVGHTKTAFSLQIHDRFVYSGSGDSTIMVHNLHTAAVEHTFKDNKGIVNCVYYKEGFLFTGGMDRLVRCYNTKSHKLVQVYYGADMGAIKSIIVHDKMLITGNTSGSVDMVPLDLKAKNVCPEKGCKLNFGIKAHLSWHLQYAHK